MLIIQLVIIQVITFIALVFVLRKIMYSASYLETKRLQQLNVENALKAQELAAKVEEAQRQYEEKLESAERDAKRLKAEAQVDIEKLKQEALNKAKQEGERIISQALNTKDKIREELEAQMLAKTCDLSRKLASQILSANNQKVLHESLLDDVLKELGGIEPLRLEIKTTAGELYTPCEIDNTRKQKLSSILSEKTGRKIILEEKIDPEIIAGVTIKLGNFVIDGSLSGKLKEAAENLKKT